MAILTSKGVRAPHQLKGRRNVRISRDRTGVGVSKIENIVDGLEKNIDNLDELAHENQDNIRTLSDTIKDIDEKAVKANGTISGGDLNDYYTAGIWRTVNKTVLNRPSDMNNGFGQLLVISGDQYNYPTQIYSVEADDRIAGDNIYYRKYDGADSGSWTPWQKIITNLESISKYTELIRDPLDIIEYRKGYCDGDNSIHVPSNFSWGSRNIEFISGNQVIITLTGVTSDALPHHWVNVYNYGEWSGWRDTIN